MSNHGCVVVLFSILKQRRYNSHVKFDHRTTLKELCGLSDETLRCPMSNNHKLSLPDANMSNTDKKCQMLFINNSVKWS